MHSSLRFFQITLIITQITTVKGSVSTTSPTAPSTAPSLSTSKGASAASNTIAPSSSTRKGTSAASSVIAQTSNTTAVLSSSTPPESSVTAWSSTTLNTSTVTTSAKQSTAITDKLGFSYSSTIATDVPAATSSRLAAQTSSPSAKSSTSTSEKDSDTARSSPDPSKASSVSSIATPIDSQMITALTSMELATSQTYNSSDAFTKATNSSHPGLSTRQTQSMNTSYSSGSASLRGSITQRPAEPSATGSSSLQTLTTSHPVSLNWTDWSVDSSDCQKYCSGKGGTVTASRQCNSHSKTLQSDVCTKHGNLTKVVRCGEPAHCPISGKEAFRSSISALAVSILLTMLSSTSVQD